MAAIEKWLTVGRQLVHYFLSKKKRIVFFRKILEVNELRLNSEWTQSELSELMSSVTILRKSASKVDGSTREVAHGWKGINARLYLEEERNRIPPADSTEQFVILNSVYCMSSLENQQNHKINDKGILDALHRVLSFGISSINILEHYDWSQKLCTF